MQTPSPFHSFLARLEARGLTVRGRDVERWATCPHHADGKERTPSLHITDFGDHVKIHCFTCCDNDAVLDALGLSRRDLYANRWGRRAAKPRRDRSPQFVVNHLGRTITAPALRSMPGADIPGSVSQFDRRALAALHNHAFWAPQCCPSQQLLADELGCSREAVNRACRRLRDAGLIAWHYEYAPGARWWHNVYALLTHWHRPDRRAVMTRLKAIRARRRPLPHCPGHTKGTAEVKEEGEGVRRVRARGGVRGRGHPPPDLERRLAAMDVYFRRASEPLVRPRPRRAECSVSARRMAEFGLPHLGLAAAG